ncbi:MAG: hypothetical protein JW759_08680 [Candidatus Coatesbacteria bacterium]|nr:hypothetical protein [Candidatus Coatesbacteria bacterium]
MKCSRPVLATACLVLLTLLPSLAHCAELAVYGGTVLSLAVSEARPARVFAGTEGGTIFRSDDAGRSWIEKSKGLISSDVKCLAIDPFNTDVVYAGTGGFGVFRTRNGGEDWEQLIEGLTLESARDVRAILPLPNRQGVILIATGHKVYRSGDGGETLALSSDGLTGLGFVALAQDPCIDDAVFAGAAVSGVFRSVDGGLSWEGFDQGLPASARQVGCLLSDNVNDRVLLGTSTGTTGVYSLPSGAASWQQLGSETFECLSLAVLPSGAIVAGTDYGTKSFDPSSEVWIDASEGLPTDVSPYEGFLKVRSILGCRLWGERVVVGLRHFGVFASRRWPECPFAIACDGLSSLPIVAFDSVPPVGRSGAEVLWALSPIGGVFKSTGAEGRWVRRSDGIDVVEEPDLIAVNPCNPENMLVISPYYVYESRDSGLSWGRILGFPSSVNDVLFHPTRPGVVYVATRSGLKRSIDSLERWETVAGQGFAIDLVEASQDGQVLYAGGEEFCTSRDGGDTWVKTQAGLPEGIRGCLSLAVLSTTPQVAYASVRDSNTQGQHGVYVTRDGGQSWTLVSGDLFADPDLLPQALVVTGCEEVLALTDGFGLFEMVDQASGTWDEVRPEDDPLIYREKCPTTMKFCPEGGSLVLGLSTAVLRDDQLGLHPRPDKRWRRISDELSGIAFAGQADPSGVAGSLDGSAFISTDNGSSWTMLSSGLESPTINVTANLGAIAFLAGTDSGLYQLDLPISEDSSWQPMGLSGTSITAVCIATETKRRGIWGGSGNGGVMYSNNGGASWTSIGDTMGATSRINVLKYFSGPGRLAERGDVLWPGNRKSSSSMSGDATRRGLWCGTQADGLFVTQDNGQAWDALNDGLPNLEVRALCFSPDGFAIAVVADPAPWILCDDRWFSMGTVGLPGRDLTAAAYSDTVDSLFVGDEGGGLYVFSTELGIWEVFDPAPESSAPVSSVMDEQGRGLAITRIGAGASVLPLGAPEIQVHCNRSRFGVGDILRVSIQAENPGPGRLADVYAAVVTPEGSLLSWPGLSTQLTPLFSGVLLANLLLPPSLLVDGLALPGNLLPGRYTFYAAITRQGGFECISNVSSASFEFSYGSDKIRSRMEGS